MQYDEEYQKIIEELQTRELGPQDYDILMSLQDKTNEISLNRWLTIGYEKAFPPPDSYLRAP